MESLGNSPTQPTTQQQAVIALAKLVDVTPELKVTGNATSSSGASAMDDDVDATAIEKKRPLDGKQEADAKDEQKKAPQTKREQKALVVVKRLKTALPSGNRNKWRLDDIDAELVKVAKVASDALGDKGLTPEQLESISEVKKKMDAAEAKIASVASLLEASKDLLKSDPKKLYEDGAEALALHRWLGNRGTQRVRLQQLTRDQVSALEKIIPIAMVRESLRSKAAVSAEVVQDALIADREREYFTENEVIQLQKARQEDSAQRRAAEAKAFAEQLRDELNRDPLEEASWLSRYRSYHLHKLHGTVANIKSGVAVYSVSPTLVAEYKEGRGKTRVVFTADQADGIWYSETHDYNSLAKIA